MKKLISDSGGMKIYVEIRNLTMPEGVKYLRISSFYDGAKDPNSERTKLDMCLTSEEFAELRNFLNEIN
jgi:hypothetical protein